MPRFGVAAILAILLLSGCNAPEQASTPAVEEAWVRLPAVPGRPAAAYFTLRGGAEADLLKGVSSPSALRIEMHESKMSGAVMRMDPLKQVDVPAGSHIVFGPMGKHLMLFGLDPAVKPGDEIELRFALHPPGQLVATAEVRAFSAGGHEGH